MNHPLLSSALALSLLAYGYAHAETKEAEARALFKQARELASEGKLEQACSKFESSLQLEPGVGTQFNLADCWERIGHTGSAYRLFSRTADAARQLGQIERAQVADQRAHALLPDVSRLQVKLADGGAEVSVSQGEVKLAEKDWSEPVVVDPGHYTVTITSTAGETWSANVDVVAKANVVVTVPTRNQSRDTVEPALSAAETSADHAKSPVRSIASRPQVTNHERPARAEERSYVWPTVALITGMAGIGLGTVSALNWKSDNDQARSICPAAVGCSDAEISRHQDMVHAAKTDRALAYLGFGVGLIGITTSTILYSAGSTKRERTMSVGFQLSPSVGAGQQLFWAATAHGIW